jgi:hypothetical protein
MEMIAIIYFAISLIVTISLGLDQGTPAPALLRIILFFLVLTAWPWFLLGWIFSGRSKKSASDLSSFFEKAIVNCDGCAKKLRVPKGLLLDVKCPNCAKEWRDKY